MVHDAATSAPPAHRRRRRKESPTSPPPIGPPPVARWLRRSRRTLARQKSTSRTVSRPRFHHLTPLRGRQRRLRLRCRRTGRSEPAHLRTDGCHWDAEALNPLAKVGRHTDPDFMAARLQVRRERHNRLDITTRSDCRKQYTQQSSPAIVLETWAQPSKKRTSM